MAQHSMKAILRDTALTADTLRAWERRYGAVKPSRTASGRRVYTEVEWARLRRLAELVRAGHAIGSIARLPDEELFAMRVSGGADDRASARQEVTDLLFAVDSFDLEAMRFTLARVRYGMSPRDFAFRFVPEVMSLVGKRIQQGRISISQEHAFSEIIRGHLKAIYADNESLDGALRPAESLVFCTREGDPHDFGLMMAAIACRARGYKTHYLGRELPVKALLEAAQKIRPSAVVLGVSEIPKSEEKCPPDRYHQELDAGLSGGIEMWIGGGAARRFPRKNPKRDVWVFRSVEELDKKLSMRRGGRG